MRRKLTEVEIFYIKNNTSKSIDEIVNDLGGNVSKKIVKDVLDKSVVNEKDVPPESSTVEAKDEENPDAHNVGNLMGRQKGVVVMTEAASELADANRMKDAREILKVKSDPNFVDKNRGMIHVIRKKSSK